MAIITTSGYLAETAAGGPLHHTPAKRNDLEVGPDGAMLDTGSDRMLCAGTWTTQAMCRSKTALFFAPPGEREGRRRRREALASAYCAVCPVQALCKVAGRQGREHGIWGGENDEERAAAGFAPRSPHRRAVAQAARQARQDAEAAEAEMAEAETAQDGYVEAGDEAHTA